MVKPTDLERFSAAWWEHWSMPEPNTGCHIWLGSMCKQGYGRVWFNGRGGNPAHRVRYITTFGPYDPSLKVCHRCDHPWCVNPDHLFLGTQKDNLRDMFAKGRGRPRGRSKGWREAA